jgi:hypothetical protein
VGTAFDLGSAAPFYNPGFNSSNSAPLGQFFYTTSFTLSGGPPYTLTGGLYASDNQTVDVYLNGHDLGIMNLASNSFLAFSQLNIPGADFVTGTNFLTFDVFNEQNPPPHSSPSGLNVQGSVTGVPEPSVLALIASGLPALGLMYSRRRRRQA